MLNIRSKYKFWVTFIEKRQKSKTPKPILILEKY